MRGDVCEHRLSLHYPDPAKEMKSKEEGLTDGAGADAAHGVSARDGL